MVIGICGKQGSGKTTLTNELAKQFDNLVYLNVDNVAHDVINIKEVQDKLKIVFGEEIIDNGITNRRLLSSIVFSSKEKLDFLEAITWEYMEKVIDHFLEQNKDKVVVIDWALLPRAKYFDLCDLKILLDIPYEVRKERILKRDNISEEHFDARESKSLSYNKDEFDIVLNDNNYESIRKLVKKND